MRLGKKGKDGPAQVRVFDGYGLDWLAQVINTDHGGGRRSRRSTVTVQCVEALSNRGESDESPPNPTSSVWLCVTPPKKKERFRWMIEKTTELGVDGFLFIDSEFSESPEKSLTGYSYSKLYAHLVEAAEQCERRNLPQVVSFGGIDRDPCLNPDTESILKEADFTKGIETLPLSTFLDMCTQNVEPNLQLLICRERGLSVFDAP